MKNSRFGCFVCLVGLLGGVSCEARKERVKVQGEMNQEGGRDKVYEAVFVLDRFKKMISVTCVSEEVIYPRYYGGTYINDAGKPVILTTDTTKRELIRKLAGCDEVVVLPCAISYRYLKDVDDKIKSCLGDRPGLIEKVGINTFGILTDKNCVDVSLVCCTPEQVELFKSLVVDDPCITFSENVSRVVLQ